MKTLAIVSGASRGLGEAITRIMIDRGFEHIIALSRSHNGNLSKHAAECGSSLEWHSVDLSDIQSLVRDLDRILSGIAAAQFERIVLVNNAGVLEPIERLESAEPRDLIVNHTVNATAPLLTVNAFLRHFGESAAKRIILNITSGLGSRAMTGVAPYCVSKAAMNMLTRCIATEQSERSNPVLAYAISPGTVETHMQEALRGSDEHALPERQTFVGLKESGSLYTPEFSAGKIVDVLDGTSKTAIDSGSVAHVRDL